MVRAFIIVAMLFSNEYIASSQNLVKLNSFVNGSVNNSQELFKESFKCKLEFLSNSAGENNIVGLSYQHNLKQDNSLKTKYGLEYKIINIKPLLDTFHSRNRFIASGGHYFEGRYLFKKRRLKSSYNIEFSTGVFLNKYSNSTFNKIIYGGISFTNYYNRSSVGVDINFSDPFFEIVHNSKGYQDLFLSDNTRKYLYRINKSYSAHLFYARDLNLNSISNRLKTGFGLRYVGDENGYYDPDSSPIHVTFMLLFKYGVLCITHGSQYGVAYAKTFNPHKTAEIVFSFSEQYFNIKAGFNKIDYFIDFRIQNRIGYNWQYYQIAFGLTYHFRHFVDS